MTLLDVAEYMKTEAYKLERDYGGWGPLIKERNLEVDRLKDFEQYKVGRIAAYALMVQAIGQGETKKAAEEVIEKLMEVQKSLLDMKGKAKKRNKDVQEIVTMLKKAVTAKKITVEGLKETANGSLEEVKKIEKKNKRIKSGVSHLINFVGTPFDEEKELTDAIEYYEMIVSEYDKQRIRNVDAENCITELKKVMDGAVSEWFIKPDFIAEVTGDADYAFPEEVIEFVIDKIQPNRDYALFYNLCGSARPIRKLKEKEAKYKPVVYGTEKDLFLAKEAEENGVDFIGKGGISAMDKNKMDVVLNLTHQFTFVKNKEFKSLYTPEQKQLLFPQHEQIPKGEAWVVFNIPFYFFEGKIADWLSYYYQFSLDHCYRVDDALKNVLFVAKYKRTKEDQSHIFDSILYSYDSLPHYTEMSPIVIQGGDLTLPEKFVPSIREAEDFMQAFPDEIGEAFVAQINKKYTPEEAVVELQSPLQEYRAGHEAAVACSPMVNMVYHGQAGGETIIYCSKIVKRQIEERTEEVKDGVKKKYLLLKSKNIIFAKTLRVNGEVIQLLGES